MFCYVYLRSTSLSSATAPCVALPPESIQSSATAPCVALPPESIQSFAYPKGHLVHATAMCLFGWFLYRTSLFCRAGFEILNIALFASCDRDVPTSCRQKKKRDYTYSRAQTTGGGGGGKRIE